MCLGIPGKVLSTVKEHDVLMGKVSFDGVSKMICLAHVPDVAVGDYVLVHVGFALAQIDEEEAKSMLAFLDEMEIRTFIRPMRRLTQQYNNREPLWEKTGQVPSGWGHVEAPGLFRRAIHSLYVKYQFLGGVKPKDQQPNDEEESNRDE